MITTAPPEPKPLVTAEWVARRMGISLHRTYELTRTGTLPSVRLGRAVRYSVDAIERWIASGGQALPGGWKREA